MNILFVVEQIDIEHLGSMLLAAIIRQQGHYVEVSAATWPSVKRALARKKFSLIGYSAPTIHYAKYWQINQIVKKQENIFSIFGGAHPTFAPEIIGDPGVDCLCRGEGEEALVELTQCLAAGQRPNKIKNLWIRADSGVEKNPVRPLIEDLDSLPFPARDLFPQGETFTKGKMHVMTSRGCPYQCSYCSHAAYAGLYGPAAHRVRRRSAGNVIAEIAAARQTARVRLVMFEDDLFTSDRHWLNEFCDHYARDVALPFFCYVRADTLTKEVITQLKAAGCVSVSLGVETVNSQARETVLGRHLDTERIRQAADLIKKCGMRLETTNIIGIPGTALEDDFSTMDFNRSLGADYASVKMLMPYPGTPLRRWMEQAGYSLSMPLSGDRLAFVSQDKKYKHCVENLRWLFGIGATGAWLGRCVRGAAPVAGLSAAYRLIFLLWEGYTAYFRLYPTGARGFWWGLKKYWGRMVMPVTRKIFFQNRPEILFAVEQSKTLPEMSAPSQQLKDKTCCSRGRS